MAAALRSASSPPMATSASMRSFCRAAIVLSRLRPSREASAREASAADLLG
jgi:hypothetical protein